MKAVDIKDSLTPEQIISILQKLGVDRYQDTEKAIIFPTICHNSNISEASMKLYYYKDTKLFHCYTECSDSFDIFELFKRFYQARGISYNFYNDIYYVILNDVKIDIDDFDAFTYEAQAEKYQRKKKEITLTEYPEGLLNLFVHQYPAEWIEEGITPATMDKYNIRYSISQNKIIIPHYDVHNRLVGIRGRALNPEEAEKGKYKPIWIEGKMYNHPLSLNLYGLNYTKPAIDRSRRVIIFESEKSVLLMDSYFGEENNSVAICGSSFNKNQLKLLLKYTKAVEFIIALDKEYSKIGTKKSESYFNKIREICQKYNKYGSFYYLADKEGLLREKDSPIDRGPDIFLRLLEKKIPVGE